MVTEDSPKFWCLEEVHPHECHFVAFQRLILTVGVLLLHQGCCDLVHEAMVFTRGDHDRYVLPHLRRRALQVPDAGSRVQHTYLHH